MSADIHRQCSLAFSGDEKVHLDLQCSSQMQASDLVGQGLVNEPVNEFGGNSDGDGTSCTDSISSEEEDDFDVDFETALKDIFSEEANSPTVSSLLSAMKGSREKSGASPRKLTVKWAPDVYDPPPTVFSQMLARGEKQQKSRKDRKNVKDKQKGGGKASRVMTGKGKKQHHIIAGSSKKRYKSLDVFDDFGYDVDSPEW